MRFAVLILMVVLALGCTTSVSKEDLKHLNGYWEIASVEFPNGQKKEYGKVNPTIDYLEWDGSKGFRKKVYPKLDGTFDTSDDAEPFEIMESDGSFSICYNNPLSSWNETLTRLDANRFSVVNEEGITYNYRRHEPINIEQ
ncbi:hypothetical protein [Allomuricauda sp. d1]|uniref:hypothetical protein n=1 Tax=Allomuricauda sp. d1 TaxID=3136725 RepID=UPI0031D6E1BE